jgi:PmbA protein
MTDYKQLAADVVAELKRQGADACDVFIATSNGFNTTVRLGQIERLQQSISKGMGLRVFKNGAQAITYTTDFRDKSVKALAAEALQIVKVSSADQYNGLAPKEALGVYSGKLMMADPAIAKIPTEKKIEIARETESVGRQFDKRITNSQGASWSDSKNQVTLANSDGFVGQYETTNASFSLSLVAEENNVKQTDYWFSFGRFANLLDTPKAVGEKAAQRTLAKLGAKKPKSQVVPMIIPPEMSSNFVGMIFGAASGGSIFRKSSFLVDKLGQQIASPLITIVDDATIADGPGCRPFDGEGVKSNRVTVVDKGVLKSYMCDSYSSRRLKQPLTGTTARGYTGGPGVSASNLFIEAGASDPKDILKSVKSGLYLTGFQGSGFNNVTGDFSQGAYGFWIENGELAYAVQEITIAGKMLEVMKNVAMVGNDLTFKLGSQAAPTLLISEVTVGGA